MDLPVADHSLPIDDLERVGEAAATTIFGVGVLVRMWRNFWNRTEPEPSVSHEDIMREVKGVRQQLEQQGEELREVDRKMSHLTGRFDQYLEDNPARPRR